MTMILPFSTPIWSFSLNTDFLKAIEAAYLIQKDIGGRFFSNMGGYQSKDIDLKKYLPEVFEAVSNLKNFLSKEVECDLDFGNTWLNINKKGHYNATHVHPFSFLSAVIYLQIEENSGKIVFKNPTPAIHYPVNAANKYFFEEYWLLPKQGDIFVFPSYVEHYVQENKSDLDRISLAINFVTKEQA